LDLGERFFACPCRTTEAHLGEQAGGARSQVAHRLELELLPLQSPKNASHFWIILLLSSGAPDRRMISHVASWITVAKWHCGTSVAGAHSGAIRPAPVLDFRHVLAVLVKVRTSFKSLERDFAHIYEDRA
jgi:hypothetical protein